MSGEAGYPGRPPEGVASTAAVLGGRVRDLVRRRPLVAFFVLAYGLSWSAWLPFVLSENGLGVWAIRFPSGFPVGGLVGIGPGAYLGPATAAVVVTALAEGRAGLRVWRQRLTRWRVAPRWYAFAVLGYPALILVALIVMAGSTGEGLRLAPSISPPTTANISAVERRTIDSAVARAERQLPLVVLPGCVELDLSHGEQDAV